MFEPFAHFLSYGSTDQQTMRDLSGSYQGLIVPGTIAAFQREGTGGFVLSLSARPGAAPYLIDPRFPLFQTLQIAPKVSHEALAELLGAPEQLLRADRDPVPGDFSDQLIELVASNWVDFNLNYEDREAGKFKKYAKKLNEDLDPAAAQGPEGIIAPYLVAESHQWWERSKALFDATVAVAGESPVFRVVAAPRTEDLNAFLEDVSDEQLIVWVSGFKEIDVMPGALVEYGRAIGSASRRDQGCFALYGGFFSVLLGAQGLLGACHGIGYGEHRSWPELSQSGPPPPRYYAPRFHRYINQDLALGLWRHDADLTGCGCEICEDDSPVLSYHDLMKHSVFARQAEIDTWAGLALGEAAERLAAESEQLVADIQGAALPDPLLRPALAATSHLSRWSDALAELAKD